MAGMKIRKGDTVAVLTGKDKGKTGEVLRVLTKESRVIVQGVNMVKRHSRPTQIDAGGIKEMEASLHISNVAHIDPTDGKPTRVGYKTVDDRKVRFSRRTGDVIDN
ncbi:50S ribosomal protein L24 [Rhodovibrionaceae bacterium A322]